MLEFLGKGVNGLPATLRSILFSTLGFSFFSLGDAAAKWLSGHYPVVQITWLFAVFSCLVLLSLSPWLGGLSRTLATRRKGIHLLRAVLNPAVAFLAYYGLSHLSMAELYTIFFCAPFLIAMISIPLFKETIGWHRWAAIGIGFLGVLIALRPGLAPLEFAVFTTFLAMILFACLHVLSRTLGSQETVLSLGLFPFASGVILFFPFALPVFVIPSPSEWAIFALGGAFFAFGLVLVSCAFRLAPPSVAAPFHYTQMIWGLILGILVFGDWPDIWMITGALVIVASGLYLTYREVLAERRIASGHAVTETPSCNMRGK